MERYTDDPGHDDSGGDLFEGDDLQAEGGNPDDSILGEFINRWEDADDERARDGIVGDFCGNHPHLRDDIRELIEARRGIGQLAFVDTRVAPDPERLGPYKVLRLLACGGMGKVYEARDARLTRRLAVKTIRGDRGSIPRLLERFQSEYRALARLHHTNIIPIYNAGEEDGLFYFVMPLIEGPSLEDLVVTMGRSGPSVAGTMARTTTWDDLIGRATIVSSRRRNISRLTNGRGGRAAAIMIEPSGEPKPAAGEGDGATHRASWAGLRGSLVRLGRRLKIRDRSRQQEADYFRRVAEIVAVAAEAIHSAHEMGVLHFDIKPSNILIEPSGEPKPAAGEGEGDGATHRASWAGLRGSLVRLGRRLKIRDRSRQQPDRPRIRVHPWVIDFGLANPTGPAEDDRLDGAAGVENGTHRKGTKGFMAPEMLARRDGAGPAAAASSALGRHTDVWGLGVTLCQLLTLHLPFDTEQAVLDPGVRPKPPREHVADLPRELEAVVLKALEKRREDRYATAAALAEDLRRWLAGFPTGAGRAGLPERTIMWARRRPAAAFAAGMTAAFAIACSLVAVQAVNVNRAEARAAEQEVQARKRELDLIALPRLRAPIRNAGWAETAWGKTRELASGRPDADSRFQGEFAALLEGLDVRLTKAFPKDANMLAFDPEGKRLLMGRNGRDARGRLVTRLVMGHPSGQGGPSEKAFRGFGVVGFGTSGAASFLEIDPADPSILRLRDAITGDEERILKSPRDGESRVISIALSRDGSRAAGVAWPLRKRAPGEMAAADKSDDMTTAGDTATLVVWEVGTGRVLRSIEDKQPPTHEVILSPDGSLLATWDASGRRHEVSVWAVGDGKLIGRFESTHLAITGVAFGRDPVWREAVGVPSWRLAVGEHGGKITVWDLRARAVRCIASGSAYDVKALDFSPDGALLASAGRNALMIWDAASGECLLRVPAGNYQFAVAFSPDGHRLAVAKTPAFGGPGGVDVFDLDGGRGLRTLRGLSQLIETVVISADGRRIAAMSNDWEVGLYDALSGTLLGVVEAPEGPFTDNAALALNADGSRLICSAGAEAKLWDVDAGRLLRKWGLPPALSESAGFYADGRLLLVRQETEGKQVPPTSEFDPIKHPRVCRAYRLSERGDKAMVSEIPDFDRHVECIAATPEGAYFIVQGIGTATGKRTRIIHLYDGPTGKQIGSIPTAVPPIDKYTGMRFDPGGTRLRVATQVEGPAEIFEVPSLRPLGPVGVDVSPNAGFSRVVKYHAPKADAPGMVVLSDRAQSGRLLRIARDVDVSGTDVMKFSRDGDYIVWGNRDGTVTVCDLNEVQRRLAGVGLGWQ